MAKPDVAVRKASARVASSEGKSKSTVGRASRELKAAKAAQAEKRSAAKAKKPLSPRKISKRKAPAGRRRVR